ncbi:MAG: 2-oxo acid dehydrogenase subunit E2 [Clostridiales bacterium]|nr:2-oxo acid dehydrogenase subunit E2 [Clostridiales bacterium]
MAVEIFMPKAGMDMKEGKIVSWLKNVGDKVLDGEGILSIETDKVTMEVESPAEGTLLCKYFEDGATVPVVTVIGYVGNAGEAVPAGPTQAGGDVKAADNAVIGVVPSKTKELSQIQNEKTESNTVYGYVPASAYAKKLAKENGISLNTIIATGKMGEVKAKDIETKLSELNKDKKVAITPLANRIAEDKQIDIRSVSGTGYKGKVLKVDILGASSAAMAANNEMQGKEASPEGYHKEKISGIRKIIAERMLKSHTEIPPITLNMSADVTELLVMREKINAKREKADRISINDFVVKAVAKALHLNKNILVSIEGDDVIYKENAIHIGMAVATDKGLIVPVIRDADKLSLEELSKQSKELAKRAREGKLTLDELKGSTFTVTNLGMFDVESFSPIINQPDAGILGVCTVKDELALADGQVIVRKKLGLSLTVDHRIVVGAPAAVFLKAVKSFLEDPISIII